MTRDLPRESQPDLLPELPEPGMLTVRALEEWARGRQNLAFPEEWLNRLKRDPRRGIRRLADRLQASGRRRVDEDARIEALLEFEHDLWEAETTLVAGVDEAGVGPLAGPVVAAAVLFPPNPRIPGIQDSKQLTPEARCGLARQIRESKALVSIGIASVSEIDRLNIYHAGLLAMRRAVEGIFPSPEHLLVDGREIPDVSIPQTRLVQGDRRSYSIAAASIIAKTERDRMMEELDEQIPGFGFAEHKGYPTRAHREALARLGPCSEHRRSFPAVAEYAGQLSPVYYSLLNALSSAQSSDDLEQLRHALRRRRGELHADEYRRLYSLLRRSLGRRRGDQPFLPGLNPEVS